MLPIASRSSLVARSWSSQLCYLNRAFATESSNTPTSRNNKGNTEDSLKHAIHMVHSHDPAGYIPGQLLPHHDMQETYYGVRSFWIETGLRFGTTAKVPAHSAPAEHLDWWEEGVEEVYKSSATNNGESLSPDWNHPTLSLLHDLVRRHDLSKQYFDGIVRGRRKDLDVKQYKTLDELAQHAQASCGSLAKLVLESGDITPTSNPAAFEAARLVGVCHGLTNALRLSIPVISATGKLIVPEELCVRYGIQSPRYLLSALGLGDADCRRALQSAVQDIANEARSNLRQARDLRSSILESKVDGEKALSVLIPGVASEVFLDRLQNSGYDLTARDLRNVGFLEQGMCIGKMVAAYYQKSY